MWLIELFDNSIFESSKATKQVESKAQLIVRIRRRFETNGSASMAHINSEY